MRELGVFCGTFNPIHWGHLLIAESARDQFKLDKVIFVTTANPPHRNTDLLDAELRHELVLAAIDDNEYFEGSRLELERDGPSYTVDTLRRMSEQNKDCRLNLLVGEDNMLHLHEWHEATALFELCRILVAPRESAVSEQTQRAVRASLPQNCQVQFIEFPHLPVSSSLVRERLRRGVSILYLVPPAVNSIIQEKLHYAKQH